VFSDYLWVIVDFCWFLIVSIDLCWFWSFLIDFLCFSVDFWWFLSVFWLIFGDFECFSLVFFVDLSVLSWLLFIFDVTQSYLQLSYPIQNLSHIRQLIGRATEPSICGSKLKQNLESIVFHFLPNAFLLWQTKITQNCVNLIKIFRFQIFLRFGRHTIFIV